MSKKQKVSVGILVMDWCIGWAAGALHVKCIDPVCEGKLSKLTALVGTTAVACYVGTQINREIYKLADECLDTDLS